MRHYIHLIILLLTISVPSVADTSSGRMRNITLKEGLSGLTVTDICPDKSGMVWLSTSNGVSLYNGRRIIVYPLPDEGKKSFCYQTAVADDGTVYAATSAGVLRLAPFDDNFQPFATQVTSAECLLAMGDKLYVGNRLGLFEVSRNGNVKKISVNAGVNTNNSVRCIRRGPDGQVWFTTRNEINRLDTKTGRVTQRTVQTASGLSRFNFAAGRIFIGTKNNGLLVTPLKGGQTEQVKGIGNIITQIRTADEGRKVCVATDGNGAFQIDSHTLQILKHYGSGETGLQQLPSNAVYDYHTDIRGTAWIAMYRHGLCHELYSYPLFHTFASGGFTTAGMDISCFYNTPRHILVAKRNGFYLIDKGDGKTQYHDTRPYNGNLIKDIGYRTGSFYLGTYDAGVLMFDISSGQISRIPDCPKLSYASVTGITSDRNDNMWFSTSEGLFRLGRDGNIRNYNDNNSKLLRGMHNTLFDRNGNGWIGTSSGICLYISGADVIKNSEFPQGFFNSLNFTFSQISDNIYGYSDKQLFYTDPSMRKFGSVKVPDGIIGEICTDFAKDRFGTFWIVSEKGLFAYNEKQKTVRHFGADVGMTGETINPQTLYIDNKDTLWIATNDGLKYASIAEAASFGYKSSPKVCLDYISIDGEAMSRGQIMKANTLKTISIGWNIVAQRMETSPLMADYSGDDNKIYEYSIDHEDTWHRIGANGPLTLSHMLPGTHSLRIRLAGAPSTTTEYTIGIYPTAAAWVELILILTAAALTTWWYRYRRHTKALLNEHKETEQALIEENRRMAKANEEKYAKSRVADRELSKLARQMDEYVREKKLYLDTEVKMSDIAAAIKTSPSALSQVFTLHLKQNYYDYINAYRIAEFKRRIAHGDHKRLTIKALSEECGFKKTAFFSTFRKMENMTPTEYIKNNKKQNNKDT